MEDEIMELTLDQVENIINDMLNTQHTVVEISGSLFDPARILKACDPIAYRQLVIQWADRNGVEII